MLDCFQDLTEIAVACLAGFPIRILLITTFMRSHHWHHGHMLATRFPDIRVCWTKDRNRRASKCRGEMGQARIMANEHRGVRNKCCGGEDGPILSDQRCGSMD